MVDDVRKPANTLRDVLKPFFAQLDDQYSVLAHSPQFVTLAGEKFYLKRPLSYMNVTRSDLAIKICGNKCSDATGFLVALKDDNKHVFECDKCKQFSLLEWNAKGVKNNE